MERVINKVMFVAAMTVVIASAITISFAVSRPVLTEKTVQQENDVLVADQSLPFGVTSLARDEAGIRGVYKNLTFETRRGPRVPRELRDSVAAPEFEIDVRILNKNGEPFLVQIGGHEPVDGMWSSSFEAAPQGTVSDPAEVRTQFEGALEMVSVMHAVRFQADLAAEHKALLNLEPLIRSLLAPAPIGEERQTSACNYRNSIAIHDQPCCAGLGRHSGTIARNIAANGTTTQAWAACNHGTCPQQMPLKCQWTSDANRCTLPTVPVCSTPYNALSCCGGHNCNDDSSIQYTAVRLAYLPHPQLGNCNNSTSHYQIAGCY